MYIRFFKERQSLLPNKLLCFIDCHLHQRVAVSAAAARRDPAVMTTSPKRFRPVS